MAGIHDQPLLLGPRNLEGGEHTVEADGQIPDLVVRGEIGRGGMGCVQLARQTSLTRDVVIPAYD